MAIAILPSKTLAERNFARLPPFGYQVLIRAEAKYPSYPSKFLMAVSQLSLDHCQLVGPIPATMEKKAGYYRYHLIVQSEQRKNTASSDAARDSVFGKP